MQSIWGRNLQEVSGKNSTQFEVEIYKKIQVKIQVILGRKLQEVSGKKN